MCVAPKTQARNTGCTSVTGNHQTQETFDPEARGQNEQAHLGTSRRHAYLPRQFVLVGTDGGVAGKKQVSKGAAWSVAVESAPQRYTTLGGLVRSMDHSTAAAEREAAYEAVKAACEAQCPIHLFIDNLAVQREVDKCFRGTPQQTLEAQLC